MKTLLLSLAISDLGVGLVVQPLYVVFLVMRLKELSSKNRNVILTDKALGFTGVFLCYASFFGVMALTADRFLALYLHLRYQELATHRRVVSVVMFIWVISALLSILGRFCMNITYFITGTIAPVFLILTVFCYCKIYLAVRRHRNQIQDLQVQLEAQNVEGMATLAKLNKSSAGTFYVYLVFVACYLPHICVSFAFMFKRNSLISTSEDYTLTLVFLNSSLNPLIYCWKMRQIRYAIRDILQKIMPRHG